MKKNKWFLAITILITGFSMPCWSALNQLEIYKFKPCSQFQSLDTSVDGETAEPPISFPKWGGDLGGYLSAVNRINKKSIQPNGNEKACFAQSTDKIPPLVTAALKVTNGITEHMSKAILAQREILDWGIQCFRSLKANPASENVNAKGPFQKELFADRKYLNPSDSECSEFSSGFIADLDDKFNLMRKYMALISKEPTKLSYDHDKPYSEFLLSNFYPSLKTRQTSVVGLLPDEIIELPEFSRNLKGARPDILYEQLISTNPILLQYSNSVDPTSTLKALENIRQQYDFDLAKFMWNPPQEIFLYTPYVLAAINDLPEHERSVACQAVSLIHKNLKTIHEKLPRFTSLVGLILALSGGSVAASTPSKALISQFLSRSGYALISVNTLNDVHSAQRFSEIIKLCSTVVSQPDDVPQIDDICQLTKAKGMLSKMETNIKSSAMLGVSVFGVGRWLGRSSK